MASVTLLGLRKFCLDELTSKIYGCLNVFNFKLVPFSVHESLLYVRAHKLELVLLWYL